MSLCLMFISKSEVFKKICVAKDLIGLGKALLSPSWAWPFHYHMSNNDIWLNIHITSENFPSARLQVKYFRITQLCNDLFPRWFSRKEPDSQCRRCRRPGFNSWVGKIPWRRKWQPISVFLPEKFHRERILGATGLQRVWHVWATEHAHSRVNTVVISDKWWSFSVVD